MRATAVLGNRNDYSKKMDKFFTFMRPMPNKEGLHRKENMGNLKCGSLYFICFDSKCEWLPGCTK